MPAMSGSLLKPPIDGNPLPGVLLLLGQITGWFTAAQTSTDAEVLLSLLPISVPGTLQFRCAPRKAKRRFPGLVTLWDADDVI